MSPLAKMRNDESPVAGPPGEGEGLRVLAVDDEPPALDELAYLLRRDKRVGTVFTAVDAAHALRLLGEVEVDVLLLDIRLPGLDGLELARLVRGAQRPPAIVFITAYGDAAVDAYEIGAVDFLLKPLRADRLAEALRRVLKAQPAVGGGPSPPEVIPVELAGVTRWIRTSDVLWVHAQGDYARLHTATGSHLVRIPISVLEQRLTDRGFVRTHRSYLAATAHVEEMRVERTGSWSLRVGGVVLPVSRRYVQPIKDRLSCRHDG